MATSDPGPILGPVARADTSLGALRIGRPVQSAAPNTLPPIDVAPCSDWPSARGSTALVVARASGPKGPMGTPGEPEQSGQGDNTDAPNAAPGIGSGDLNGGINDRQEPFTAQKAYADVLASVNEAPTARFMAGRWCQQLQRPLRQLDRQRKQLRYHRVSPLA